MKLLLGGGDDPNKPFNHPELDGKAPLHLYAENANAIAATHVHNGGAQVNGRTMRGRMALHFSVSKNHIKPLCS